MVYIALHCIHCIAFLSKRRGFVDISNFLLLWLTHINSLPLCIHRIFLSSEHLLAFHCLPPIFHLFLSLCLIECQSRTLFSFSFSAVSLFSFLVICLLLTQRLFSGSHPGPLLNKITTIIFYRTHCL
jgi:hypothetical protein